MTEPLACAVMLTKDRPEMAARAVRCFREQTYPNAFLMIDDTGSSFPSICYEDEGMLNPGMPLINHRKPLKSFTFGRSGVLADCSTASIGVLRNGACHYVFDGCKADIVIHWDDDDWSHPNRIAEQVALLQSSAADCVGFNEVLFWDERSAKSGGISLTLPREEAWHYHNDRANYCIGATLCYWRKTWEAYPFEDVSRGEDDRFLQALERAGKKVVCADSIAPLGDGPRVIHAIHGGNTWTPNFEEIVAHGANNFRRVTEWDDYCREAMKL